MHTKTPWEVTETDAREQQRPRIHSGLTLIAEVGNGEDWIDAAEEWDANAAFIVRAVNSHEALVEALRGAIQFLVAWQYEYSNKPETPENLAAKDQIQKAFNAAHAALAQAREE